MGLFLSVLVACAGVIELISVCSNVGRHLTLRPITGNLSQAKKNYIKELAEVRKREESDIQPGDCAKESNSCLERPVPTFRLNSHEDIEIQYNKNVLAKSRTPSPRRFLVIEKEVNGTRESPSPRQFVVSEEPQGLRKSQCQTSIPEFFIQEQKNSKKSPNHPRYVLKDHEGRSASPIPLPSQFLVTEKELAVFQLTDPSSAVAKTDSNYGEHCRRSPSPYPPLDLPQTHRNSISKELVDESVVSILEVDEDLYKSRSPSPRDIEENVGIAINFKTNANLLSSLSFRSISQSQKEKLAATVIERARCISELGSKENNVVTCSQVVEEATSCSQVNEEGCTESFSSFAVQEDVATYDENYLNNLDGLSKQKFVKRNYTSRRTVKRLSVNNSIEEESSSNSGESSNNENVSKVLAIAAECESPSTNSKDLSSVASTSKEPDVKKEPEPFWLIFSGEYTKAMNKDWHGQHFCCWQCDESLTGQRYVLRDDHPYCVSCYESVFANACEKCSRTIGIDSKDLSYKDKHWHEACFLCTTCGESLVDKQFGSKGDRIYCGSCYDQQFASRCDGCHEIFRAGTKKMEYKTRQWHEKCFCCCVCKVPIGTQSFIPREQEIYCAKCYEEKFATRCIKCNKVITSGGVTYKNEPWHRECFTCTHCQKSLAGERFTSRDEKPFCAECFGELFAKRCTACNKPITGIGGTKFISFEDRHWHNDCFFCASCRTSLVGRGFITDNEDIICPECAKQKLM